MSSVEALCTSWAWESPSCPCRPCFYCLYYVYVQPVCGDVFSGGNMRQLCMGVSLMSMPSVLLLSIVCICTTGMWWCLQWRHYAPVEHGSLPHVHAVRASTVYICTTCMWWCIQWRHYASVVHGSLPHVHAVRASTVYNMYIMYNLYVVMSSVEALCASWAWESPSCPCRPCLYCIYYVYVQPVCVDVFSEGTMRQLNMGVSLMSMPSVLLLSILCIILCTTCMWWCLQWRHYAPVEHGSLPHVHAVRTSTVYSMYMYNLYVLTSSVEALCASWAWESPSCPCRPCFFWTNRRPDSTRSHDDTYGMSWPASGPAVIPSS